MPLYKNGLSANVFGFKFRIGRFTPGAPSVIFSIAGNLPAATLNTAYSFTPTVANGAAPITYSLVNSLLPPGLSFNTSTAAITGTPT